MAPPFPVSHNVGQILLNPQADGVSVALGVQQNSVVYIPDGPFKGEGRQLELTVARVEPGQGEQVLDDVGHPVRLPQNDR